MLYFVATPIGNLKDISLRAIEVLNTADEIACEDTRHSLALLNNLGIKKPLFAYHKFNERASGEKIIGKLKEGKNIAVISDAGTPLISDPGSILIRMLKENNLDFTVVPGACALINALVLSGMDCSEFTFLGFLPDKAGERKSFLEKYKSLDTTLVFYSAPHDIKKDISSIYEVFGDRKAVAVKEITKLHESAEEFNLKDGISGEPRGEYVLIVEKCGKDVGYLEMTEEEHINAYIASGMDKKEAVKAVAKERKVSKSSLYKYTIDK